MAAPQQHALTNTSCSFPSSTTLSPTDGKCDHEQTSFRGDLLGRISVRNDHDIPSVVSSVATLSEPILTKKASRKTKPCSLCGTAALRSQSSLITNSPASPKEHPVVLLHRLEDGLAEGDVDSLRAFGTIRLHSAHRQSINDEDITDDSERKNISVSKHMTLGNLPYKTFKRRSSRKQRESVTKNRCCDDVSELVTNESFQKHKSGYDCYILKKNCSNAVKSEDCSGSNLSGEERCEARECDNKSVRIKPDSSREKTLGAHSRTVSSPHNYPSQYLNPSLDLSVSAESKSHHPILNSQHLNISSSQTETLESSTSESSHLLSLHNLTSQINVSSISDNYSINTSSQSSKSQDTAHKYFLPTSTQMSIVFSPVVPLTTTTLTSSQNLSSPSIIPRLESPPSPPSSFSPPFMCSPSPCHDDNQYSSCSTDIHPSSSPYSPCTIQSLPASPASLPSLSETPPSPTPSLESPPLSPTASSGHQSEVDRNQVQQISQEKLGGDSVSDITDSVAHCGTILGAKVEPERSKIIESIGAHQCYLTQSSLVENSEELSRIPSNLSTDQAVSNEAPLQEGANIETQSIRTETQVNLCLDTSNDSVCGDVEESVHEKYVKSVLNSESKRVEEKNSSDSRNSLMKVVLKLKHSGNQQFPLESEKNEYNKENGIPKIVLTLRGDGPNKEYSCSNRLRNEGESFCGENGNHKKHKSKKYKRQKTKDREKVRTMKADKHKRHVELFGEDSNDDCDIIPNNLNEHSFVNKEENATRNEEKVQPSLTSITTEETLSFHGERNSIVILSSNEVPPDCVHGGESQETVTTTGPTEEPSPLSFPNLIPDTFEIKGPFGDEIKVPSPVDKTEIVDENQTKPTENSKKEDFKLVANLLESHSKSHSKQKKEATSESPGTPQSSENSHQDKQHEDLIARRRRTRNVKDTEAGRNSDSCLWVSFGMNPPIPLPVDDLPSLDHVFTGKEKLKPKEKESPERKASFNRPPDKVTGDPILKAPHKMLKDKENTEKVHEALNEPIEQDCESKQPPIDYRAHKSGVSYSLSNDNLSSHEVSTGSVVRIHNNSDSTHHHISKSPKKSRESEDCLDEVVKKETDFNYQKPIDSKEKDNDLDREELQTIDFDLSCDQGNDEMKSEENSGCIKQVVSPNNSSRVYGDDNHINPSKNVIPNQITNEAEKLMNTKNKEAPDDFYYRPKKIQRVHHIKANVDPWNEKKNDDHTEDMKTQVLAKMEESNTDRVKSPEVFSSEAITTSLSETDAAESDISRIKCKTFEPKTEPSGKTHQVMKRDCQNKDPQNNVTFHEISKYEHQSNSQTQEYDTKVGEVSLTEQTTPSGQGEKGHITENLQSVGKVCYPGKKDILKDGKPRKEKQKLKKPRREKRKHKSGPGSRCSVLQEAQSRREAEHEEGRERRLAQEIKGFNWLEEKIKNNSLRSSHSVPFTPTTSLSTKELEETSWTLSKPSTTHSTQSTCDNKEEELTRKNKSSGSTSGLGFKRHLQTAVPPLIHSSRVTALPKRRQSTPTTLPCSSSSALSSLTSSIPSMTVQSALYTHEQADQKTESRRVESGVEKSSSTCFEHKHGESDKATLYSSTSSTKATLYGIKNNGFKALYDTVSSNGLKFYSNADSAIIDTKDINTSPPVNFYGSAKYQESGNPTNTSSNSSHNDSSIISLSQDSSDTADHRIENFLSFKSDTYSSKNSGWCSRQASDQNSNSQHSAYSPDSNCPQRFSHKQTLLRRAFQEMMKSDSCDTSILEAKDNQCTGQNYSLKTDINKPDELKCKKAETVSFTISHSSSGPTSLVDLTNFKYERSSGTTPPLLSNESSSEIAVVHSSKLQKNMNSPVSTATEISHLSEGTISEDADHVTFKQCSDENKMSKTLPDTEENGASTETLIQIMNDDKRETSFHIVSDNENVNVPKNTKDAQSNYIDCIITPSGDIDMKLIKDEISYDGDGKYKNDAEVQPNLLLSVLYKELMKTRQEVEKLRKVQELMLTEKGEKKEDDSEQNNETKAECVKPEENSNYNENIKKRKDDEAVDGTELRSDTDDSHYIGSKRSKISIRSDLLSVENRTALDTTSHSLSSKQTSDLHQISSSALSDPSPAPSDSVTIVENSAKPDKPDTGQPSRLSPAIKAASPRLSDTIVLPQQITSPLPRCHTSPGVSSQGVSSPGLSSLGITKTSTMIPKYSPTVIRRSPDISKSNNETVIVSRRTSRSPSVPASSPGILRTSPITPSSPGVLKMNPELPRTSPGISSGSPGIPRSSPGAMVLSSGSSKKGSGMINNGIEISIVNCGVPEMSPTSGPGKEFNPPTKPSLKENLNLSHSPPPIVTIQANISSPQSVISPVIPVSTYHQNPITSTAVPLISQSEGKNCPVSRISPSISKIDIPATLPVNKTDTSLTNASPHKLRSVFGISNSEIELMPVSAAVKQPLHEPQAQTYLNRIESQRHFGNEAPILLSVGQGVHQETNSSIIEPPSNDAPSPLHTFGGHDDPKKINKSHQYIGEMKRHAFSTSDLPDHASSAGRQLPPLKPVSALLRRHSDNMDIHSVMHQQATYPSTSKSGATSLHSRILAPEIKTGNSVHRFNHPLYTPAQYPLPNPNSRIGSESNPSERNHRYQQGVSMGMQHHLPPGSSVLRSLGPDKATIFPVQPIIPTGIRPFRPTTPPVTRTPLEHFHNENFYRTNFTFFEKIREKFAHSVDNRINVMDRPQPSTGNVEKHLQPQTFAPRVIVRESVPEASSHIPSSFSAMHFPNQNPRPPNTLPSLQNSFPTNIHSNPSIQHMSQSRLHSSSNPAPSAIQRNANLSGRSAEKVCFHCPQPARFICSGCKKAWYCSAQCQREHWNIHSTACVL